MTRYARIDSGRVAEPPIVLPDDVKIADAFPPELARQFVPCPDTSVVEGWSYDGTTFAPPPPPPPPTHQQLTDYAAARRYAVEISGVTGKIGDETVTMSTKRDDRDGARDTLIAIMASLRASPSIFKFEEGPRSATNEEMQTIIAAAFGHVQAAYDVEATVVEDIGSGKITTFAEIDAALPVP